MDRRIAESGPHGGHGPDPEKPAAGAHGGAVVFPSVAHDAHTCPCTCHRADEVARDLLYELADREADIRRRLRRAQLDVAESADWVALACMPTYEELRERRAA